jgi:hypothetical protein
MYRLGVVALATLSVLGFANPGMAQSQINEQTGRPLTGNYQDSLVREEQERAASAAQQQANAAMLNRLDENYKFYAPGGPGAPRAGAGAGVPPLKSRPLLPAAKNPLLGMWRMGATKPVNLKGIPMFPGTEEVVNGAIGGACASVFGKPDTVIRFTPTQFNWVAPDGHDEVLNHVEYRSDGANVIIIPSDGDIAMIVGMSNKDNAVVAFFGCTMSRTSTSARLGQTAAAGARVGGTAAPAAAAGQAILSLTVGQVVNGVLSSPPAGTQIYVTTQDPDANLVKAGFAGPQPVEALFLACKSPAQGGNQERCNTGMKAILAGALGYTATDPNGHAQSGAIPPGHYYIVGSTPYQGHSLLWHMPVDLKPGANAVSLTPQNGSISH